MSKPPNNNNNKKWHNQSDFSYFNNPNYFGFYNQNQDWNNNYSPPYNCDSNNQSFGWDNNPTPTNYYNHNYGLPNYSMNNPSYHNFRTHYNSQQKKNFNNKYVNKRSDKIESKRDNDNSLNIRKPGFDKIAYKKIKILRKTKNKKKKINKEDDKNTKILFKINKNRTIDEIETKIESIDDLLQIGQLCNQKILNIRITPLMLKIYNMTEPLEYLKNMVGLESIKQES